MAVDPFILFGALRGQEEERSKRLDLGREESFDIAVSSCGGGGATFFGLAGAATTGIGADDGVAAGAAGREGARSPQAVCGSADAAAPACEDDSHCDPLAPGSLRTRLVTLLRDVRSEVAAGRVDMARVAHRHYLLFVEDLEDEPHDVLLPLLEAECTFRAAAPLERLARLSKRLRVRESLAALEARPAEFWAALIDRWLIDPPYAEVVMTPDAGLSPPPLSLQSPPPARPEAQPQLQPPPIVAAASSATAVDWTIAA